MATYGSQADTLGINIYDLRLIPSSNCGTAQATGTSFSQSDTTRPTVRVDRGLFPITECVIVVSHTERDGLASTDAARQEFEHRPTWL